MILQQPTNPTGLPGAASLPAGVEQAKAHLLPIIAHELRQPLTAILFAIEQARDVSGNPSAAQELREVARREAAQMSRIIDDVMEMYCGETAGVRLRIEDVDLASVAREAIATVEPSLTARGHSISVSLPEHPISLRADRARLRQVLTNLLSNAAKYTGPGGLIYLSADVSDEKVVLRVRRQRQRNRAGPFAAHLLSPFNAWGISGIRRGKDLGSGFRW